MAHALTATSVAKMKPNPYRRIEIPDAVLPGLYLVVQPSGIRSWAVRYRYRGKPRKLTLGRFPVFDLANARSKARDALLAVAAGHDPCAEKRRAKRADHNVLGKDLVSTHVETFLARYVRTQTKARTADETERRLRKYVLPKWGSMHVQEIGRRDVIELLDGIVDAGAPITANRTLTTLKTFFGWLADRSVLEQSPCARVKAPAAEASRDRVLSDDELRLVWKAADELGWPYGTFVQELVLTAQRRDEVAGIRRSELVGPDLWTLPSERSKNGEAHDVPLSRAAVRILMSSPKIAGAAGYVFTIDGKAHISGYSGAKRKVDAKMLELAQREARAEGRERPTKLEHWTFHDLRRTAASGMARLGTPVNVIEAVLNHRGGEVSGVTATYNRYSYLPEKRRALEAWATHVLQLVEPGANNVIPLRATAL